MPMSLSLETLEEHRLLRTSLWFRTPGERIARSFEDLGTR